MGNTDSLQFMKSISIYLYLIISIYNLIFEALLWHDIMGAL